MEIQTNGEFRHDVMTKGMITKRDDKNVLNFR